MKQIIKKGRFETVIFFILSPFLSLPFIFIQLLRKDKAVKWMLAILFGLLSFLYIPYRFSDKGVYLERYIEYQNYIFYGFSYFDFLKHLVLINRPDFIFEHILYFFSKFDWNIQWLFFALTSITVYSIFTFIERILQFYEGKNTTLSPFYIVIIIFSLSLGALFSGVRFYFASSLFLWSIYYFYFNRHRLRAFIFLVLAISTHFSFVFFLPILLLVRYISQGFNLNILLLISLVFWFLPDSIIIGLFESLPLPGNYEVKKDSYIYSERVYSDNFIILDYLRNLWLFFFTFFILFIHREKPNLLLKLIIISICLINITYPIQVVFIRYMIVVKVLALAYFFIISKKNVHYYTCFLILCFCFLINFIVEANVIRYNLIASYNFKEMWNIYNLITTKRLPNEFL